MFTTLIVQPIFNVLVLIYALIPGRNFGLAIIIFTLLARWALFPMLKKQLRHTKAMRDMQPELKKIKEATKGNKQQESVLTMQLYKEREVKPLAYIGLMIFQIALFLALFSGLNRVVNDPQQLINFSYEPIQNLSVLQDVQSDISLFDNTLFGSVDLARAAVSGDQGFYFPAFVLVLGSSIIQFFQIKQTMPSAKQGRKLRDILKDANNGTTADTSEVNAAMGRNMSYVLPIVIFVLTIGFPAGLSLYWFVGGLIAYMQQSYLLKQDEYAMESIATATVVSKKPLKKTTTVKKPVEASTKKAKSSGGVVTTRVTRENKTNKKAAPTSKKKSAAKNKSRKKKK